MAVTIDGSAGISTPDLESAGNITANGLSTELRPLVLETAKSATGTAVDFTDIPSWVKRVTVMFSGVSTSGTSNYLIQVGSGSVATSGYRGVANQIGTGAATTSATNGFPIFVNAANATVSGFVTLVVISGNTWTVNGLLFQTTANALTTAGDATLSGTLDRVRITTVNGTDTFDAGTINVMYE